MSTSPDEAAFLKAIADNPADETARLAFADWLGDRGDTRAEFAKLSADFLRCVRGLADRRRAHPPEWLEVMDPLFNRFETVRLPNIGEGIESGTVTAVHVSPGTAVAVGQALVEISTDKASLEVNAEHAGVVISVHVRPGDLVPVGCLLVTYLSLPPQPAPAPPAPTPTVTPVRRQPLEPRVPSEPLLAFIQSLERGREKLRTAPPEAIETMLGRQFSAAVMVFGFKNVVDAKVAAERNRGWDTFACHLETRLRLTGFTDEQILQERVDVHIETLRVLLERHGQPTGFTEPPAGG